MSPRLVSVTAMRRSIGPSLSAVSITGRRSVRPDVSRTEVKPRTAARTTAAAARGRRPGR